MRKKRIHHTTETGVRKRSRVTKRKHNLINDMMETAQQPGIVRGALILSAILIVLACIGIVYVFLSSERYTAVSPAMQNKMIVAALKVENNISPQGNSDIVRNLASPPLREQARSQNTTETAKVNAEISKSLSN